MTKSMGKKPTKRYLTNIRQDIVFRIVYQCAVLFLMCLCLGEKSENLEWWLLLMQDGPRLPHSSSRP